MASLVTDYVRDVAVGSSDAEKIEILRKIEANMLRRNSLRKNYGFLRFFVVENQCAKIDLNLSSVLNM